MSYTPFNAPILSALFGDMECAKHFSVKADIDAMLRFEVALAKAEGEEGIIPKEAATAIAEAAERFEPDVKNLSAAASKDGLAVPNFVEQLRMEVGEYGNAVHFGATSQDVVDTSLILRLKELNQILKQRLESISHTLSELKKNNENNAIQARTRSKIALPTMAKDRIALWLKPLRDCLYELESMDEKLICVQFGGPVGTLEKLNGKGDRVRAKLAETLELNDPGYCWHTDRRNIVSYTDFLITLCGSIGKMGQDIVLMAQDERREIELDGGGNSSAMAHKKNPILAESLVTLAHFTACLSSPMKASLVHEQERSGIMWSLEWMIVPQLCVATGASLRNAEKLLHSIRSIGTKA